MSLNNVLCIIGTDTGVGKTIIGSSICSFFYKSGLSVGVFKPAESGLINFSDTNPSDGFLLQQCSRCPEPLEKIVPYRLSQPLSPSEASKIDGVSISRDSISDILFSLSSSYDLVLMEGAGGLLVPYTDDWLFADLLESLNISVLLVGRSTLGTVNHTLLTLSELERRNIPVKGFVLNRVSQKTSIEESSNPHSISFFTKTPFLGLFPFIPESFRHDPDFLSKAAQENLDLDFLSSFKPFKHENPPSC